MEQEENERERERQIDEEEEKARTFFQKMKPKSSESDTWSRWTYDLERNKKQEIVQQAVELLSSQTENNKFLLRGIRRVQKVQRKRQ